MTGDWKKVRVKLLLDLGDADAEEKLFGRLGRERVDPECDRDALNGAGGAKLSEAWLESETKEVGAL